jgi:riboflavin biosynthesis pyrimidine reductase
MKGLTGANRPKLLDLHNRENIFVVVPQAAEVPETLRNAVQILEVGDRGQDFAHLNTLLWDHGMRSVLVEGGASVLSSFVRQKAFHRLNLILAPNLIGAKMGMSWTRDWGIDSLADKMRLTDLRTFPLGEDVLITSLSQSVPGHSYLEIP